MTAAGSMTGTATRRPARRPGVRQFVPPQHGAWAMLAVPWLGGVLTAGFHWVHLPLLGAWLAGYLCSYYVLQAVKTRRPARFRAQLLLYAPLAVVLAGLVVAVRPQVLAYAPVYALLSACNALYARRRRERALLNDIASVVQSCVMVFVAATVAGTPPGEVVPVFAAVLLYFTGTVLYVKTMIRERDNPAYLRASVTYHAAAAAAATLLGGLPAVVFTLLLARAVVIPRFRLAPKHVGMIELGACVLLLAAVTT